MNQERPDRSSVLHVQLTFGIMELNILTAMEDTDVGAE
jgi:hypothetical protein